ncbi:hypothetical protein SUGI_0195190 [Cryptomeria japonica]|nr:hypothetical protein SUGI_0195190 [Cryptomeria japonica]
MDGCSTFLALLVEAKVSFGGLCFSPHVLPHVSGFYLIEALGSVYPMSFCVVVAGSVSRVGFGRLEGAASVGGFLFVGDGTVAIVFGGFRPSLPLSMPSLTIFCFLWGFSIFLGGLVWGLASPLVLLFGFTASLDFIGAYPFMRVSCASLLWCFVGLLLFCGGMVVFVLGYGCRLWAFELLSS